MDKVLSEQALSEFNRSGYVRTGIILPDKLRREILESFGKLSASHSNWGLFRVLTLKNYPKQGIVGIFDRVSLAARKAGNLYQARKKVYDKSIYGSSSLLEPVLNYCLDNGLADQLGETPLLVGHDIYLENLQDKKTFGFHEDNFGWEIFFQTEDDVSIYIALCDLNKKSGGRLIVDSNPCRHMFYPRRNQWLLEFSDFCMRHGAVEKGGLVSRESVQRCTNRELIAEELERQILFRSVTQLYPDEKSMQPIDATAGEVVLFNNKRYHDIEPWNMDYSRSIYIIRCFPMYDIGLKPPLNFLNNMPCNRYYINPSSDTLENNNVSETMPEFVPVP